MGTPTRAPMTVLVMIGSTLWATAATACGEAMVLEPSSTSATAAQRGSHDTECAPADDPYFGTFTRHQAPVQTGTSPCMAVARDPSPASPDEEFVLVTNLGASKFQSYYSATGLDNWTTGPVIPLATVKGASCPDPHFVDGDLHVYFEANQDETNYRFFRVVHDGSGWSSAEGILEKGSVGWDNVRRSPSVIRRDVADPNPFKYLLAYWAYESGDAEDVNDATLGMARSADGVTFSAYPNPILTNGPIDEWNRALTRPRLIADPDDPDIVHLVYAGFNRPIGRCGRIGYACSHNGGRNWNHLMDPVFNYGESGDWDYETTSQPLAYVPSLTTAGANDEDVRLYYSANYDPGNDQAVGAANTPWDVFQELCPVGSRHAEARPVAPPVLGMRLSPNPSSRDSDLVFELDESAPVTVTVYDASGRRMSVLADRSYLAGEHRVRIPRGGLVSGVYTVVATAGDVTEQVRFIFVE